MTTEHVAALGRVAHLLADTEDTGDTMIAVAEEGRRVFGASRAAVFLLDEHTGEARAMVSQGLSPRYLEAVRVRFREMHSAGTALQGKPYFTRDAREDVTSPIHAIVREEGFAGVAALPLVYGGGVIGWLSFYHDAPREYAAPERVLAGAFADQAALAIGRARLLENVLRVKTEWQSAFDGIGNGLALVDTEGRIERANRFIADLAQVEITALPGRQLAGVFASWPPGERDPLRQARLGGHRISVFLDTVRGQHVVLTATPREDGGFVVAVDDLTHFVRLEARYSRLVETAHEAILLVNPDGRVIFANPAAAVLFGRAAGQVLGERLEDLLPEEPGGAGAPSALGGRRYEALVRRADGPRLADVSVSTLEERGQPAGLVVVARDVTRERLALESLRRSERRFRALFNRAPLAIFTLDREGRFVTANRAAFRLAGFSGPRPGSRLEQMIAPADWPLVATELARSFEGATGDVMFHFRRVDGEIRQAAMVTVPVEERGGLSAVLAIARDVTDEVELRERLSHSEKMAALGALVSGVAHELNNPLAGIAAMAQSFQLEGGLSHDMSQGLETMRQEAMRAARIVTHLLTFARQRPLSRRDADLNALVRDTFGTTPALAAGGVVWTLGLDPTLPGVSADADQIRQVVTNLLVNATQAMLNSERREGLVRTWSEPDWVGLEVLDTGPGLPAEAISRIFEPFFTTKAQGQGTGLGLSISHGIIRAHGGEIRGENRAGGGARFLFRLPRDPTRIPRFSDA